MTGLGTFFLSFFTSVSLAQLTTISTTTTVSTHGPLTQSSFLDRMGLPIRVDALLRGAPSEERRKVIQDAANRLVDLNGMGKEYKVFGITSTASDADAEVEVYPFIREQKPVQEPGKEEEAEEELVAEEGAR